MERSLVVVAIDEALLILQVRLRVAWLQPAIDNEIATRVVYHIPAILAQNTIIHRNLMGHSVERFYRSAEIVAQDEAVGKLCFLAI